MIVNSSFRSLRTTSQRCYAQKVAPFQNAKREYPRPPPTLKSDKFRTEEDLIGTMQVPANALFGVHSLRAQQNFLISNTTVNDYPEFIIGMVLVKKAEALANKQLGTIDPNIADYIVKACDHIINTGEGLDQFDIDMFQGGAGTSVNMNTNEVVSNIALRMMGHPYGSYTIVNPADHVNQCQSTNDAYPTGIKVALYHFTERLIADVESLATALEKKAKEFSGIIKMGRTQLQDAVPMTLGQEFNAFAVGFRTEVKYLKNAQKALLVVNLGATAIGTGVNTPRGDFPKIVAQKLSEVTGWNYSSAEDLIEATSDCGVYVHLSSAVKHTGMRLAKMCNDLRLLASGPRAGLKEINLPEMQAGSSIMPGKVNPVILEVANQVVFKVYGNDVTVLTASDAGQLQLNVMEPVVVQALFESLTLMQRACNTVEEKCIKGITANADICKKNVMNSIGIVTYLNPIIGHHNGDLVSKTCVNSGKGVKEVVLELGLLTEKQLDDIFSFDNLMNPKFAGKFYNTSSQNRS